MLSISVDDLDGAIRKVVSFRYPFEYFFSWTEIGEVSSRSFLKIRKGRILYIEAKKLRNVMKRNRILAISLRVSKSLSLLE